MGISSHYKYKSEEITVDEEQAHIQRRAEYYIASQRANFEYAQFGVCEGIGRVLQCNILSYRLMTKELDKELFMPGYLTMTESFYLGEAYPEIIMLWGEFNHYRLLRIKF